MRPIYLVLPFVFLFIVSSAVAEPIAEVRKRDVEMTLSEWTGSFELLIKPLGKIQRPKGEAPHVIRLNAPHRLILELPFLIESPHEFVRLEHRIVDRIEYGVYRGKTRVVIFLREPPIQDFFAMADAESGAIRLRFAVLGGAPQAYTPDAPALPGPSVAQESPPPPVVSEAKPIDKPKVVDGPGTLVSAPPPRVQPPIRTDESREPPMFDTKSTSSGDIAKALEKAKDKLDGWAAVVSSRQFLLGLAAVITLLVSLLLRRSRRRMKESASVSRLERRRSGEHSDPANGRQQSPSSVRLDTCYRLLGVRAGASKDEIDESYSKLISHLRNEVHNTPEISPERIAVSQEKIKILQDSYNRIMSESDPVADHRRTR